MSQDNAHCPDTQERSEAVKAFIEAIRKTLPPSDYALYVSPTVYPVVKKAFDDGKFSKNIKEVFKAYELEEGTIITARVITPHFPMEGAVFPGVMETVKSYFGIQSPSKVNAKWRHPEERSEE